MFGITRSVLEQGIGEGLHLGAQICVMHHGEVLLDEALGSARTDVPMTTNSLTAWFSAGKPITAVAIAQLVEKAAVTWDTPVSRVIPEFGGHRKQEITLRHVLTHTAGMRNADALDQDPPWPELIARICELPLEPNWVPGEKAGYHVWASWQILGEVISRVSDQPVSKFFRDNIFLRLGMKDSWLALPPEEQERYGTRTAFVYDTSTGTAVPRDDVNSGYGLARCKPGGSARGPVRELARFYEALRRGGEGVLEWNSVDELSARHRVGLFDETFQFQMDWCLGFIPNSNRDGFQMPYSYGRHASHDAFGHSGNQASCAFLDPRHELVVAWVCNGMPGERRHQQRQRAINNAIYEDLGLTSGNGAA